MNAFVNMFKIPDLRKRLLFTLGMLAVYRLGSHVPTPGIDAEALQEFFAAMQTGVFGFLNLCSGGALSRLSIFALGIMPYISASIILQLLTVVWPYLEKLSKEGELGRRKINQYTRYGTIALSIIQSLGMAFWLRAQAATRSALDDLAGIGPARKRALLRVFGSSRGLRRATVEEIAAVPGIGRATAERIREHLDT